MPRGRLGHAAYHRLWPALSGGWPRLGDVTDGLFIAFEGGDGAGKSTQVALLRDAFEAAGRTVTVTRQPGGTELGQRIRDLVLHGDHVAPRAEALLFAAARAQLVASRVRPLLEAGEWVLLDRFVDSSLAYQGGGRGLGVSAVRELNLFATGGLVPDVTFLLRLSPAEGLARISGRAFDRLEGSGEAFFSAVAAAYDELAAAEPDRFVMLDALQPPDVLLEAALAAVSSRSRGGPGERQAG